MSEKKEESKTNNIEPRTHKLNISKIENLNVTVKSENANSNNNPIIKDNVLTEQELNILDRKTKTPANNSQVRNSQVNNEENKNAEENANEDNKGDKEAKNENNKLEESITSSD